MITYDNNGILHVGLIMSIWTGSVVIKASAWALSSALLCLLAAAVKEPGYLGLSDNAPQFLADARYLLEDLFNFPYSHYIISYMLGFLMIFRVQLSYGRYWDGLRGVCESLNRLNAAAGLCISFDELAEGDPAIRGFAWRQHMMHLFSLLARSWNSSSMP